MKKLLRLGPVVMLALFAGIYSGCEWESDADTAFNTSGGAGVELNFSGQYVARETDGQLVTGRPDITYFLITQTGNRLDVVDNLGERYEGVTGSPGVIAPPVDGTTTYPNGAMMSLMNFTFWKIGPNGNTIHDDIYFEGFLRFLAVTDIADENSSTRINIGEDGVDEFVFEKEIISTYSADRSNSMMILEGQWREGDDIRYVDGWSNNFKVSW